MHSAGKQMLNAQAANGRSEAENVDNSRHVVIGVHSANLANLRVRVKGSISENAPNFGGAQSPTNQWAYIQVKNLDTGATLNGIDGVVFAGSDANYLLEINTNGLKHYVVEVDNWVAGDVTVYSRHFTER